LLQGKVIGEKGMEGNGREWKGMEGNGSLIKYMLSTGLISA
jgi:hypothetical protein